MLMSHHDRPSHRPIAMQPQNFRMTSQQISNWMFGYTADSPNTGDCVSTDPLIAEQTERPTSAGDDCVATPRISQVLFSTTTTPKFFCCNSYAFANTSNAINSHSHTNKSAYLKARLD